MSQDQRRNVQTPLSDETLRSFHAGDMLLISGVIYTARDAAHKRLVEMMDKGEKLPFDLKGQIVYYVGPCPNRPGEVIGSAGPTTSYRMDAYSPKLIKAGLKAMIGKGFRGSEVKQVIVEEGGVYLAAIGGAAALMSQAVKKAEVIAFDDLGPEAIRKLEVKDLPVIVAFDSEGNDVYDR